MSTFSETEERQELRKQVAKLASKYGREYFAEKARSGEKTTDLWLELGRAGYLGCGSTRAPAATCATTPALSSPRSARSSRRRAARCC